MQLKFEEFYLTSLMPKQGAIFTWFSSPFAHLWFFWKSLLVIHLDAWISWTLFPGNSSSSHCRPLLLVIKTAQHWKLCCTSDFLIPQFWLLIVALEQNFSSFGLQRSQNLYLWPALNVEVSRKKHYYVIWWSIKKKA